MNTNEQDSWQDLEGEHNSDIISKFTSFQYFCSNIIHLQHLPVYFQQIKRNKGIALKAGFKLYDGFSVKTTQLFQRHNYANFADFGDKTKITISAAFVPLTERIIQCRYYAPAIGRAGEFFFNIIFLKVDGSVQRSCFVHRCSKRQSNRSNATFRYLFQFRCLSRYRTVARQVLTAFHAKTTQPNMQKRGLYRVRVSFRYEMNAKRLQHLQIS